MQSIALVTTGGTIASKETKEGKLVAGELDGEELVASLDAPFDVSLEICSAVSKPSIHLTFTDLWNVREVVMDYCKDPSITGVVVTSGTDTLEEVAYFLELTLPVSKPVVVTGSQRGPEQVGSDASVNLRNAVITASDARVKELGVVVIFNERMFSAKYVRKEHASNVQGFNAFGYGYFGIVDNDQAHIFQKPLVREVIITEPRFTPKKEFHVEILKVHLGASAEVLQFMLDSSSIDGIVIEGLGRGQVPKAYMPLIRNAKKPIVITTSAEEGEVYPSYDYEGSTYDLLNQGVILGKDYSSKKAKVKLYVLLSAELMNLQSAFDQ
ncbi:asparaginase [Geomicrobium sp. JSM 1781026]|uniref:asparaginase n=1 Tax=Geomicrobium sp. JSM 1781026 TaxID=3344580 RepID=UPI0035BF00AF